MAQRDLPQAEGRSLSRPLERHEARGSVNHAETRCEASERDQRLALKGCSIVDGTSRGNPAAPPGFTVLPCPHREFLPHRRMRDAAVSGTIASSQTREEIAMDMLQHITPLELAAIITALAKLIEAYRGRNPPGGSGGSSIFVVERRVGRHSRTRR